MKRGSSSGKSLEIPLTERMMDETDVLRTAEGEYDLPMP